MNTFQDSIVIQAMGILQEYLKLRIEDIETERKERAERKIWQEGQRRRNKERAEFGQRMREKAKERNKELKLSRIVSLHVEVPENMEHILDMGQALVRLTEEQFCQYIALQEKLIRPEDMTFDSCIAIAQNSGKYDFWVEYSPRVLGGL